MTARVAVVGGGLAGITAALCCADAGYAVRLFESRPWLGGLTHSFTRGELWVDNGQHVFLRCCERYLALLDRMGVRDAVYLQPRLDIPVSGTGRRGRLSRLPVPAPLHLSWSLLRYPWLSTGARLRFARAALALRAVDTSDPRTDDTSFGDWLRAHGQDRDAVDSLWDLVGIATLNARADEVSLTLAATVFRIGLLTDSAAADIGWARIPLRQLHGDAARAALSDAGVDTVAPARVTGIRRLSDGWAISTTGSDTRADAVVSAIPHPAAAALLPAGAIDLPADWAAALGSSPIVNIHVIYDRQVMTGPLRAGIGTAVQWVFDRTAAAGVPEAGAQYLAVSVSAADDIVDRPTAELRRRFLPALAELLPAARDARVLDFFVTRERHATFRPAPGTARLRPPAATALPGLVLAGAWTDTGWPATMEGAVRSGESAATEVISYLAGIPSRTGARERAATPQPRTRISEVIR
ncbi:hydroxysqualene dehydroxylase HpnE [Nocardia spumae]|uniref:hydroxysqualene dehydroxylase HpnE n=1 Tax=Nocardia spumae TaxID=2887190 RepID=UPI001D15288A|nr:hydroxysqualene dehydroxylase HpnE [Nocardia spumae]